MPDFAEGNDKNRARLVAAKQKLREPRPDEGFALVMLKFYARLLASNLQKLSMSSSLPPLYGSDR
jgi:hypothetical protein